MKEVTGQERSLQNLEQAVGAESVQSLRVKAEAARGLLKGRTIWHINSTAQGGGVAEILQPLVGYSVALGLNCRWLVIDGTPEFFTVTKRIHNHLHGHLGDGGHLARRERLCYEKTLKLNSAELTKRIRPGDIAVCHDPQTAGLLPALNKHGVHTVWRCHVGHDHPNDVALHAWEFLAPYFEFAHRYVFTDEQFIPPQCDHNKAIIIPPSIDPLAVKNQAMSTQAAQAILITTGLLEGRNGSADPVYRREDGSIGRVELCADVIHLGRAPSADRRLVVQVSRWDSLKDPIGVLHGFAEYLAGDSASLVLAAPNVSRVTDDPEGGRVLDQVFIAWRELPHNTRKHIHIACLPMADRQENAAIVNALQRHATVVVQKSIYEGFGLTVTEAMWKGKPIVASAVGGIRDQIESGVHGLLIDDPLDLRAFSQAVGTVLTDESFAQRLGQAAHERVSERYLVTRHIAQYLDLFQVLVSSA